MNNISGKNQKGDAASGEVIFDPTAVEARYKKWFPDLSASTVLLLLKFQSEIVKQNKTLNLVPPATLKNAEALHFADSVLASRLIGKSLSADVPLYDLSGGNGLPGVVFGVLFPQKKVIIVTKDAKRGEFCRTLCSQLGVSNVSVLSSTIEELPERSIQAGMARGFLPLAKGLLLLRKQVKKGGRFYHLKGDSWATELAQVPSQIFSHWSPSLLGQYRIPDTSNDMGVVMTEKSTD